jgi:hypothetical protein
VVSVVDLEGFPTKNLYVENEESEAKLLVLSEQRTAVEYDEATEIWRRCLSRYGGGGHTRCEAVAVSRDKANEEKEDHGTLLACSLLKNMPTMRRYFSAKTIQSGEDG